MAKPPGSCPFKDKPQNCPAVKALQDAVDSSAAAWDQLSKSYNHFKGSGLNSPDLFRDIYDLAQQMVKENLALIEANKVEAR